MEHVSFCAENRRLSLCNRKVETLFYLTNRTTTSFRTFHVIVSSTAFAAIQFCPWAGVHAFSSTQCSQSGGFTYHI